MKAVRMHAYGEPEVLRFEEAPDPTPGPDEVVVDVRAAGINPLDWKIRSGALAGLMPLPLPAILGWDIAGIVAAAGAAATDFRLGDAVFGMIPIGRPGAYAERAVLPQSALAALPQELKLIEAASVPVVGLAAHQLVNGLGDLRPGQTVLVLGAAGNVGRLCLALAVLRDAQVWAAATAHDLGRADLPADVQRLATDEDRLDTASPAVDLLIDTVGGPLLERAIAWVRPGGRVVSTVQPPQIPGGMAVEGHMLQVVPNRAALEQLGQLFAEGQLPLPEITTYRLPEAARAHTAAADGQAGKLVLVVP
ncbi:NADP-dependent oxidoreductase [Pelagibius sp.]|uniref:NADP-dependent oxidoreductase n=1 Tax=Pelagibius sp. TaxID=1931238 RepID=UPI00262EF3DD|nr:NADP-dependent oxidoreductase [Pelagibius sp.]